MRLKSLGSLQPRNLRIAVPFEKCADPVYTSIAAPADRRAGSTVPDARLRPNRCRIFGDHIVERKDGGAYLDEDNVQLLCGSCHTAKTAQARAARMKAPARPGTSR
jgi:hypothetical protein